MAESIIPQEVEDLTSQISYAATWIQLIRASLKRSGRVVTFSGVFRTLQAGTFGDAATSGQHPLCTIPASVRPSIMIDAPGVARNVNTTEISPTGNYVINISIKESGAESYPGTVFPNAPVEMNSQGTIRFSVSWII